jgi:hypothetical protein
MKGTYMRRMALTLTALAVGMALLVGCGGDDDGEEPEAVIPPEERTAEGEPPTASELAGIWWVNDPEVFGGVILARFSADGMFAIDWRGLLDTTPGAAGTYEVDDSAIAFASEGSDVCTEGDDWAWDAGIPEEGRLNVVWTEEPDEECYVGVGTQWALTRVSPSSPAGTELGGERGEDPVPPDDASTLAGIWLLEGTGQLLRLGEGRTYAIDDAGELGVDPADVGTFQLDRNGTLTFTSGPRSRDCSEGDRWVWEQVEVALGPPREVEGALAEGGDWTLRAEVTEDACDHAIADDAQWLRISP